MDVILLEDVKTLGKKGQIVKINDGYARNYVLPTGEGGRTFGTVSTKEVAEEAKKQLGLDIDKKKMKLDVPIKALGNYIIQIKLHKDVTAELTVKVVEK